MPSDKDNKPPQPTTIGYPQRKHAGAPKRAPAPEEKGKPGLVGQRIGNYVAMSLIGRGGMGSVYQARHPEIGRRVAIKVLSPELASMPQAVERFISEAKAIAAIEHPNVIDIYDFGRMENGRAFHVMELLKGQDLAAVINQKGKWTPEELLPLLRQICAGLQAAHDKGIVHRDLKPENIFVLDRGPYTIKILDFGIAKLLENASGPSRTGPARTTPGTVIGTPMVIAPEQAAGESGRVGPWTDIYSLGVIIYWMLAGRPPFLDKASGVLLAKHILNEPPPLQEVEPSVPRSLAGLVHQCLRKEPEVRPGSARQIAEAFAIALGHDPEPLPGSQGSPNEARSDTADARRRLLPIESATTIGGQTGEEALARVPSVAEDVTLMGHTPTMEAPTGPLPVRETTGGASAGEVASSGETLLQIIKKSPTRWLVLGAMAVSVAAVAYMIWRPPPHRGDTPIAAPTPQWNTDARPPSAPDTRAPSLDAAPPADASTPQDAASPDRATRRGTTRGSGHNRKHPKDRGPAVSPDRGAPRKLDSAVQPVVTPKPGTDKVGEGTLDPFGDVKDRRKKKP